MVEVDPRHCVRCGYDLDGLPRPHRCPECGLAFDLDTWRYTWRRSWIASAPISLLMGFVALLAVGVAQSILARNGMSSFWALAIPCTFIVLLYTSVSVIAEKWDQSSWSITPDGLFVRDHGAKLVPWTEIDSIDPDPSRDLTAIVRMTGRRDPLYTQRNFTSRVHMQDFRLRLESRMHSAMPRIIFEETVRETERAG